MKRIALAVGIPVILIIGARPALAVQNAPALGSSTATETPWWYYAVPGGIIALALLISARMIVRELRRKHRADDATVELAAQLVSMSDAMVGLAARGGKFAPDEQAGALAAAPADALVVHEPAPAQPVSPVSPAPVAASPQEQEQFVAMQRVMELDQQRRRMHSELDWPSDAEIERFRAAHHAQAHAAEDPNW